MRRRFSFFALSLFVGNLAFTSAHTLPLDPPAKANEIFLGYVNSGECRDFIVNHTSLLASHESPHHELKIQNVIDVRNLIIPLLFPYVFDKSLPETFKVAEQVHSKNTFYDTTKVLLSISGGLQSIDLNDDDENAVGEFRWLKFIEVDRVSLPQTTNATFFTEQAKKIPCVNFAEAAVFRTIELPRVRSEPHKNDTVSSLSTNLPVNDPDFKTKQWYLELMNIPKAWDIWKGPENVESANGLVGVTDTGCSTSHPDLVGRFWKNPGEICNNGIDDDQNGYVDDCYGWNFFDRNSDLTEALDHGTSVTGSVTANTNNYYGIAGVCWTCKIMCLRVGHEALGIGPWAEAMNYAQGWGVKIINFSAGGQASNVERQALLSAERADMLVVVAAGNSGCNLASGSRCVQYAYPPNYRLSNVLAVGATDENNERSQFSNYGSPAVAVYAPGEAIYLPVAKSPYFKTRTGTSFSSPLTAGVVALIRSKYPQLPYKQVIRAITSTCRQLSSLYGSSVCNGVVDARAALEYAEQMPLSARECFAHIQVRQDLVYKDRYGCKCSCYFLS